MKVKSAFSKSRLISKFVAISHIVKPSPNNYFVAFRNRTENPFNQLINANVRKNKNRTKEITIKHTHTPPK